MTDDPQQPATGSLTFPTGAVISGDSGVPFSAPADMPTFAMPGGAAVQAQPALAEAVQAAVGQLGHGQRGGAAVVFQVAAPTTDAMPSGATITFLAPESLTRGDRNQLMRYNHSLGEDPERGVKVSNFLLAKLITGWSYPWPLPAQDPESLDLLPILDAQEVERRMKVANDLLFPGDPSPDQHADPNSPTAPSGE